VVDLLGQGTFGQVVKCKRLDTGDFVAVKVVKNRPAYFNQGMFEIHVLEVVRPPTSVSDLPPQFVPLSPFTVEHEI
jgi:dual specificity protein kinase YAK1